jgi:hypothetical protein
MTSELRPARGIVIAIIAGAALWALLFWLM